MADEELMNEEEFEEIDEVVVLADENGEGVECEYLDTIEYEGAEYVVLLPYTEDEEDGAELLILKVEETDEVDEDGEPIEQYRSVESEETLNALFEIFQKEHADEFDFTVE